MSIVLQSSGGGSVTVQEPATASNFTQTLPAATGTVMVSGNMPAFSATTSAGQSIASATATKLAFNTEQFDTASCFDTSTYRFTPLVAGYYQINMGVQYQGATNSSVNVNALLYKNGSLIYFGSTPATQFSTSNISAVIYLNGSTDYVEAWGQQNATGSNTVVGTLFNGSLVRSA